jgi:hypothetical protein
MKLTGAKRPGDGPEYSGKRKQKVTERNKAGTAAGQTEEDDAPENDDVVEIKMKAGQDEGADIVLP